MSKIQYKYICTALSFLFSSLYANSNYTICIDGEGSKTILKVIDQTGKIIPLLKNGKQVHEIEAMGANVNTIGQKATEKVINSLFEDVSIVGEKEHHLLDILPISRVVAGMAGVSVPQSYEFIRDLFLKLGISKDHLQILSDAEIALKLLKGKGIVLISGTGSVCFTENSGLRQKVGGFGRILGDEGSGYQIGLQAIRAGLAEERGFAPPTTLTPLLKNFFNVTELTALLPQINSVEISAATIAEISPLVFAQAAAQDPVALEILDQAANDLSKLVSTALKISELTDCELHLRGNVFKEKFADLIVKKIQDEVAPKRITIVNRSSENTAVAFARTFL
jgi:N-acetylglucosamine kinase-like BadF-type ATPase